MVKTLLPALRLSVILFILCGGVYPTVAMVVGQALFPFQAQGSIIDGANGQPVGSALIAQPFDKPGYFQPRPSAAGPNGYDAMASGGSNLGPTNKALIDRVKAAVAAVKKGDPGLKQVPADLVTTSGSGLDPDISPQAAMVQVPRVAKARNLPQAKVAALVQQHITGPDLGIFGAPRVNVLKLNLALDRLASTGGR